MKGDFSRNTFDAKNHFSRVLMQQGRVLLDADWNEQTAIIHHYLRALAKTIIGSDGGTGFHIKAVESGSETKGFTVSPGTYFVDGILCENDASLSVDITSLDLKGGKFYLVYLDVWQRHVNHIEDPSIVEVALGGVHTTTRAKVVWQVRIHDETGFVNSGTTCANLKTTEGEDGKTKWETLIDSLQPSNRGLLEASTAVTDTNDSSENCVIPPSSRYRGLENHLYRVEIHQGGEPGEASFKWSRDNGSVIFPIRSTSGQVVNLDSLGEDSQSTLSAGDWVEIIDDDITNQNTSGQLLKVESVDRVDFSVTLNSAPETSYDKNSTNHPYLRRWDQRESAQVTLEEGAISINNDLETEYALEDGIVIQFHEAVDATVVQFRSGDYWLIPARAATGNLEWPGGAQPPHGVDHQYAPLAIICPNHEKDGINNVTDLKNCHNSFPKSIPEAIKAHNEDKHSQ